MWNLLDGLSQVVHRPRQPPLDDEFDRQSGQFGFNCGQVNYSQKNFATPLS